MTTRFRSDEERRLIDRIVDMVDCARLYRSCITCSHFDEPGEVCQLAGQRPPARVIAEGCPLYSEQPPF